METYRDCFKTRDLALSSFLFSTKDIDLVGTGREGKDTYFYFKPKSKAEHLVNQYWSDSAPQIQPRVLFNSMRNLKDVIFGGEQK